MNEELPDNALDTVRCLTFSDGRYENETEEVCTEEVVVICLNDRPIITQVATPVQLKELGAGFVVSQGLARAVESVGVEGLTIRVRAPQSREAVNSVMESCGGSMSDTFFSRVDSPLVIEKDFVFTVIDHIVSSLWERTGGAHCSVLFSEGRLVAKSTDIGRHNTVDKVIGHAVLNGVDLSGCVLGCTGRQPLGMITKAANAGIPIVISKAATTAQGIDQAAKAGITLIGRVKGERFRVYSHPERIAGACQTNGNAEAAGER